jgi:hypothetical protein
MIKQLDALEPGAGDSSYARTKQKVWRSMSHFAHGGLEQLSRWLGPDGVGPRHPDDEVIALLWQLNLCGLLACMAVNRLAGRPTSEHESRIAAYVATI